jgi:hypothetical protein
MTNTNVLIKEIRTLPQDSVEHLKQKRPLSQPKFEGGLFECPLDHTPNAETIAAMQEGDAILRGEIPSALTIDLSGYKTLEEQQAALHAALEKAGQEL